MNKLYTDEEKEIMSELKWVKKHPNKLRESYQQRTLLLYLMFFFATIYNYEGFY